MIVLIILKNSNNYLIYNNEHIKKDPYLQGSFLIIFVYRNKGVCRSAI